MQLELPILHLLAQIEECLESLNDEQYRRPSATLSGASIGAHLRHVLEFFQELERGYELGQINYDARQRNKHIEQDRLAALAALRLVGEQLDRPNRELALSCAFPLSGVGPTAVPTNYYRELLYNLEHTVHHMALMRIGIEEMNAGILNESFGVAESTMEFRTICAR